MANEINVRALLQCTKDGITVQQDLSLNPSIAGNNFCTTIQTTSTSGAACSVGGAATYGGWMCIQNLDDVITVGIYQDGATATVKITDLLAGEFILFKPAAAVGCKAASGTPDIAVTYFEP